MGWAGNVYYGVDRWVKTEQSWERLRPKIHAEHILEIQFENLISSPEAVLKKTCEFVGEPFSDKMLDYADRSSYNKPDASLIRQWEKKISVKEIQYVEIKAHNLMAKLGYELSEYPLLSLGVGEKLGLKINNKRYKITFSIKRFGIYLYLKERVSRVFKMDSVHKQITIQMNENDKTYLK